MRVLLTGGTGYIGSHTAVALLQAGHQVTLLDNLSNSKAAVVGRIAGITGQQVGFHQVDMRDLDALTHALADSRAEAVIHLAGLKAVGESVAEPLRYYDNNLVSALQLCRAMETLAIDRLVFSSSATVYGVPEALPLTEDSPVTVATSPYGSTKLYIEQLLMDAAAANPKLRVALLRYFNPAGAHESGDLGEDPNGIPSNLLPYITQVATGRRQVLTVHGDDYPTPDGTCIRDYIHVMDLAQGHVAALDWLDDHPGAHPFNLGTGQGHSVLEVIRAFEHATNLTLPYQVGPRRPGDITASFTDPTKAKRELGWQAKKTLVDINRDAWRWQQQNPDGY